MARRAAAAVIALASLAGAAALAADDLAVVGATLVDGNGATLVRDAVVVTRGERIQAAGTRAAVAIPKGVTIVDGRGRWIVPPRGMAPLAGGAPAEFLILDRDPAADASVLERPWRVVKAGRLLTPDEARALDRKGR